MSIQDESISTRTEVEPRGPRWQRPVLVLGLLLMAGTIAVIVLSARSDRPRAAERTVSAAHAATVQRRNLVETDTESGTLGYADPQTVYDRLSGTVTWLPRVGQVIRRGRTLFEVDDRPVILLYGSTPAYRDLDSADGNGGDIRQLNANLVALGYGSYGIVVDDRWQTATTNAVKALQKSLAERQNGKLMLGQVVFLPGEQLINTVAVTVGSPASFDTSGASHTEFVDLTSSTETTTTSTAPTTTATRPATTPRQVSTAPTLTKTVTVTVPAPSSAGSGKSGSPSSSGAGRSGNSASSKDSRSRSSSASSGASDSSGTGGTPILQTSSTRLVATVGLAASSQSEAVVGSRVTIEMPNGSTVRGTIIAVSPVAGSSSASGSSNSSSESSSDSGGSSNSSATVPVTITLDRHLKRGGLDQASVSVNFAQARAKHVLSVPVTALIAGSGGSYVVQEATAPHKLLPVRTGLFATGYVQISGPGIRPGLRVTDSQG